MPVDQKKRSIANLVLLLTALLWGISLDVQRMGMSYIEPFTFCAIRFTAGVIVLIPVVYLLHRKDVKRAAARGEMPKQVFTKELWVGGILCGSTIFFAVALQQIGLVSTSAGKTGFLTALYIILVPIMGLAVRKFPPKNVWAAVVLGLVGLYLLCMKGEFSLAPGDVIILISTLFYAGQIWIIAYYSRRTDPLVFTVIQLACVAVFSVIATLLFESPSVEEIMDCGWLLVYAGIVSVGLAYSMQVVAQKYADATVAALILSMESAFSAIGGFFLMGEVLSAKETLGCVFMMAGVIIAQLPSSAERRVRKAEQAGKEGVDD